MAPIQQYWVLKVELLCWVQINVTGRLTARVLRYGPLLSKRELRSRSIIDNQSCMRLTYLTPQAHDDSKYALREEPQK
jgi:hypothetical protein